jgi:hypothetical protein
MAMLSNKDKTKTKQQNNEKEQAKFYCDVVKKLMS